ncbi:MAG: hypothetical protein OXU31_02045 [Gammaproteobacteria bacterium]|nr:hypothetical protein [Gammaproteobacteria bacterium]MDD9799065.1 hypothetical protein [Gammaproteobacteria bacterium]MDD9814752.1 hypothetical protein [Gammaproteobacteria bacterium]MDD9851206.1 hypothetical protein [Gammaproteobacteria bacterium]MDD9870583.1 hypothetical protein [Gammaproteobacteria bacterium]
MTTGDFANWAGAIADIGPIYPFVGMEVPLVIAGVIFWIAWHIRMIRQESGKLEEDKQKAAQ